MRRMLSFQGIQIARSGFVCYVSFWLLAIIGSNGFVFSQDELSTETASAPKRVIDFDKDIRPIFDANCLECHGPKQAKNDFRVDDQTSLMSYVEPGDLSSSSLWIDYLMAEDDEMLMPPASREKPLKGVELAAVKLWIEEGAAWSAPEPVAEVVLIPAVRKSLGQRLAVFVGLFHPAVVHFPIALLLVSCLFCFAAFFRPSIFAGPAFHCLWIGAVSACGASVLGWLYADTRGYTGYNFDFVSGIDRHRWTGILLTVLSLVLIPIAVVARRHSLSRKLHFTWFAGAVALSVVVGIAGHQGGELVYGEEVYTNAFNALFTEDVQPEAPTQIVVELPAATETENHDVESSK